MHVDTFFVDVMLVNTVLSAIRDVESASNGGVGGEENVLEKHLAAKSSTNVLMSAVRNGYSIWD